uniref:Uncharacterized protein n=1 Tax=Anopheles darlingi TaxID=43151 RepID=A0A2M4DKF9_ANODA
MVVMLLFLFCAAHIVGTWRFWHLVVIIITIFVKHSLGNRVACSQQHMSRNGQERSSRSHERDDKISALIVIPHLNATPAPPLDCVTVTAIIPILCAR